jgi:tetratricopeptide (TPR) repeat protein
MPEISKNKIILLDFLSRLERTETVQNRRALVTYTGVEFLYNRINWEGNSISFFNNLIEILANEGRVVLLSFLNNLGKSPWISQDKSVQLENLINNIKDLNEDTWVGEFVAIKASDSQILIEFANKTLPSPNLSIKTLPKAPEPFIAHPYPIQDNFTGRKNDVLELSQWLNEPKNNVLVMSGIGGTGKSALTWTWFTENVLQTQTQLDGIVWWSFYESQATFSTFVLYTLLYTGKVDLKDAYFSTPFERTQTLCQLLEKQRYLIVFDGYEREMVAYAGLNSAYQGDNYENRADLLNSIDPNATCFLKRICSHSQSKLLITTRLFPTDLEGPDNNPLAGCLKKDLHGILPNDAVKFFRKQGVCTGTPEQIINACAIYDFHPLSLRLLSGMIAHNYYAPGDFNAINYEISVDNLVAREHHILQISYDSLSSETRELLGKIAAFRAPMIYDALLVCNTSVERTGFDKSLSNLVDRGFLFFDQKTRKFDIHPIVRAYAYDRLIDKQGTHTKLRKYFAIIPTPDDAHISSIDNLSPLIEFYHHSIQADRVDEAYKLLRDRLAELIYYKFGDVRQFLILLEALWNATRVPDIRQLPAWERLNNWKYYAWMMNALGIAYSCTGNPEIAARYFEELAQRDRKIKWEYYATSLTSQATDLISLGNLDKANKILEKASNCHTGDERDKFSSLCANIELGTLKIQIGDYEDGQSILNNALTEIDHFGDTVFGRATGPSFSPNRYRGIALGYLAEYYIHVQDYIRARDLSEQSLNIAHKTNIAVDMCKSEILLGRIYSLLNLHEIGDGLVSTALVRTRGGGLVDIEISALLALTEIRLGLSANKAGSIKNELFESANNLLQEAIMLAQRGKYHLHLVDSLILKAKTFLIKKDSKKFNASIREAKELILNDRPSHIYQKSLDKINFIRKQIPYWNIRDFFHKINKLF